jgi:hypothetical protein
MLTLLSFEKTSFQKSVLLNSLPSKRVISHIAEYILAPKVLIK